MNGSEHSIQSCVFQRESHLRESENLVHLHFNNFESLQLLSNDLQLIERKLIIS